MIVSDIFVFRVCMYVFDAEEDCGWALYQSMKIKIYILNGIGLFLEGAFNNESRCIDEKVGYGRAVIGMRNTYIAYINTTHLGWPQQDSFPGIPSEQTTQR